MKKRIFHIHSDTKFLHDSSRFSDEKFDNQLIILGGLNERSLKYKTLASFHLPVKENITLITELVKDSDLVVFYGLTDYQLQIIDKIPNRTKIAWRFFGFELYQERKDLMFDSATFELLEKNNISSLNIANDIFYYLRKFKRKLRNSRKHRILTKINYIFAFSQEEYDFLSKYWDLPQLILLNILPKSADYRTNKTGKKKQVILGNSSSPYNNHLEILNITGLHQQTSYSFLLFFSYGSQGLYNRAVKSAVKDAQHVQLIENFLTTEEFEAVYDESCALVINSYRQMALANIFTGLRKGVKVYLTPKNVVFDWLTHAGIRVYTIEDFEKDLQNDNLILSESESDQNMEAVKKLESNYTSEDFNNNISKILEF